jgi:thiosulfate dehydrogenase (quinone) large subunit
MSTMRQRPVIFGAIAVILLLWLILPIFDVQGELRTVITIVFWVAFLGLLVLLFQMRNDPGPRVEVHGPAFARFLFSDPRSALFWLPIRLYVGLEWLDAGIHKLQSPLWTDGSGTALKGFWTAAVAVPDQGRPPISYEWYRSFIQFLLDNNAAGWFSWLILLGEIAVGIGLVLGILVGIAAFFGAFMNMSFLLAGSASTNPVMFTMAIGLMLAWKVAGYIGLDRYLLPLLGTPWEPGPVVSHASSPTGGPPAATPSAPTSSA